MRKKTWIEEEEEEGWDWKERKVFDWWRRDIWGR